MSKELSIILCGLVFFFIFVAVTAKGKLIVNEHKHEITLKGCEVRK